MLKKLFYILIGMGIAVAGTVHAINVTVPQSTAKADILVGNTNGTYRILNVGINGQCLLASSTATSGLAWDSCAAGGTGISNLNGLTATTQTFATTTAGTNFTIGSSGSVHTFTFPNGSNGFNARWLTNGGLTTGKLIDNGTVLGVNATSSTVSLNVQGAGTLNPFNVSSSSGISILTATSNQRVGVGSSTPGATFAIQGTSTYPTVYPFVIASSSGKQLLTVDQDGDVVVGEPFPVPTNVKFAVNSTGTETTALFKGSGILGQSTAVTVQDGLNAYFDIVLDTQSNSYVDLQGNYGRIFLSSELPSYINILRNSSSQNPFGIGTTSPVDTLSVTGTLSDVNNIFGVYNYLGQLRFSINNTGSTTVHSLGTGLVKSISGELNNGLASLTSDITGVLPIANGGTATTSSPTLRGQLLGAHNSGGWGVVNLIAGSNITLTTSTPGQITISSTDTGVTVLATGTAGNIFNGSISGSTLTLNLPIASLSNTGQLSNTDWATFNNKLSGSLSSNQIVYATGASSTAGSNNLVWLNTPQSLGINSTTPYGSLVVQASSSAQTLPILVVASTSGQSFLTVNPVGTTTIANLNVANCDVKAENGNLYCGTDATGNGSGNSAFTIGTGLIYNATSTDEVGIGTSTPDYTLTIQGNGSTNPFRIASSTGANILQVTVGNEVLVDSGALLRIPIGTNPTLTNAGNIAFDTSSVYGQLKVLTSTSTVAYVPDNDLSFQIASTTMDTFGNQFKTATTTWYIGNPLRPKTLNQFYCETSTGNVTVRVGDGTNWTSPIVASSSGVESGTSLSNNTFIKREDMIVEVGSTASSADRLVCTFNIINTAE